MNHLKKFNSFNESVVTTDEEYFEVTSTHYDQDIMDKIYQSESLAENITGSEPSTEKSNSGNLLIRYSIGNGYLCVLGAVSKKGRMERGDIEDMNSWIGKCVNMIEKGITVLTSPNELSEPLINRVIKNCKKKNIDIDIQRSDVIMSKNGLNWINISIEKK